MRRKNLSMKRKRISPRFFFGGYRILRVPSISVTPLTDFLFQRGILFDVREKNDHSYEIMIGRKDYQKFCLGNDFLPDCSVGEERGLPSLFMRVLGRPFSIAGWVFAAVLFLCLSSFVWDVRVEGAEGYDEDLILCELSTRGLMEGASWKKTDLSAISSDCLSEIDALSWMNIRRRGMVAVVHCRFSEIPDTPAKKSGVGANLIASRDCVVEEYLIERGRPVPAPGSVVKKGDILVSGIYEGGNRQYVTYASGEVKGKVTEEIRIFVPFSVEESLYDSSSLSSLDVYLFGKKRLSFSGKHREGETVEEKTQVYVFHRIRLPVAFSVKKTIATADFVYRRSETDTVSAAYRQLHSTVRRMLSEGELLSQKIDGQFTEEGYLLCCEVVFIENIAQTLEFSYE